MMEKYEAEKESRIAKAIQRAKNPTSYTSEEDVESKKLRDLAFTRQRNEEKATRKGEEEEEARKAAANMNSWKSQVLLKKKSKESIGVETPQKKLTKVELRLQKEREAEQESMAKRAEVKQKFAEEEKAAKKKKEESKANADKMAQERKEMEEKLLKGLPQWKRDKILREQVKEAEHQKQIAADRAKRIHEMRNSRATEEKEKIAARENYEKAQIVKAREEKLQSEAEVNAAIEEVRKAQQKLALKS